MTRHIMPTRRESEREAAQHGGLNAVTNHFIHFIYVINERKKARKTTYKNKRKMPTRRESQREAAQNGCDNHFTVTNGQKKEKQTKTKRKKIIKEM